MKTGTFKRPALLQFALATVVITALSACNKAADDKMADAENRAAAADAQAKKNSAVENELAEQKKAVEKRTADLNNQIMAERQRLEKLSAELQANSAALKTEQTTWESDRSAREHQISEMTKSLQAKQEELTQTEAAVRSNRETIATETARLTQQKADLQATEAKLMGEVEAARTKSQAELQAAEEKLTTAKAASAQNEKDLAAIARSQSDLRAQEQNLVVSRQALESAQAVHRDNVSLTRELFSREGIEDALTKIEQTKKMNFLVSITGRADYKYAEELRKDAATVNGGALKFFHFTEKGEKKKKPFSFDSDVAYNNFTDVAVTVDASINAEFKHPRPKPMLGQLVDDQMIISATAAEIKKFRDDSNKKLETESKGKDPSLTSLWVIVRPISKIRIGMVIKLYGSPTFGFKDRISTKKVELNAIRPVDAKILSLDNVDLTRPGSYVFSSDVDARKCEKVDVECFKVLKKNGLLDAKQSIVLPTTGTEIVTNYAEIIKDSLTASQVQMDEDHEIFSNGMNVIGVTYTVDGGTGFRANGDAFKKLGQIYMPFGERFRLPIIDVISLSYQIVMVDEVSSSTGNPIDTWKYLNSGFVGNTAVFSSERKRSELEIKLPIQSKQMNFSVSQFQLLNLEGFKPKAVKPNAPDAATEAAYQRMQTGRKYGGAVGGAIASGKELYDAAMGTGEAYRKLQIYTAEMKKYDDDVLVEKNAEFKKRLKINMGRSDILKEALD